MNATATEIASVLREVKGNVAAAATRLKVARADLAERVRKSEMLSALVDDYRSELVDFAETQLRAAIGKGEDWAIRYVLDSARASPRGWRKPAASVPSGEPPAKPGYAAAPVDPRLLTDEQLAKVARAQVGVED